MTIPPIFTWIALVITPQQEAALDLHYAECRALYAKAQVSGRREDMQYVLHVCTADQQEVEE